MRSDLTRLLLLGLLGLPVTAFAEEPRAFVGSIHGRVQVDGQPVTAAVALREGARIVTGRDSGCVVLVGNSSAVQIGPESSFVMTRAGNGQLAVTVDLVSGKARALVRTPPATETAVPRTTKFYLRSRSAVMGVRGTEVYAEATGAPSQPAFFATLSGEAELRVGSAPPVALPAGQGARAGGGTPVSPGGGAPPPPPRGPQLEALSQQQMQTLVTDSGGRAPEVRSREDFQKGFLKQAPPPPGSQNGPGGPSNSGPGSDAPPPPPPPPPRTGLPDPVHDGRQTGRVRVEATGV